MYFQENCKSKLDGKNCPEIIILTYAIKASEDFILGPPSYVDGVEK
jgi:hypothetical protein